LYHIVLIITDNEQKLGSTQSMLYPNPQCNDACYIVDHCTIVMMLVTLYKFDVSEVVGNRGGF